MNNVIAGSVLLTALTRLGGVATAAWQHSTARRSLLAVALPLWAAVSSSRSLGWLAGRGLAAAWWQGSLISRFGLAVWGAAGRLGVRLAAGAAPVFAGSLALGTLPRLYMDSMLHRGLLWLGGLERTESATAASASRPVHGGIAWLFGLFLAALPFLPTSVLLVLAWLLVFGTIWWRWRRGETGWWPSRLHLPYFAWILVLLGATVSSVDFRGSLVTLTLYGTYLALGWAASQVVRTRADLAGLLGYALAGTALTGLAAVWQRVSGATFSSLPWVDPTMADQITRVWWPFDNPNVLASYLACLLPIVLAALLSSGDWRRWLLQGAVLAVAGLALLLTYSRGGWMAAALALGTVAVVRDRRLLALGIVAGLALLVVAPDTIIRRLASIVSLTDSSNYYRISLWTTGRVMLQDHWQYGVGLGMQAFARIYPDYMLAGARAAHLHNLFLQTWIELGIGGLLTLLWVLLVFVQDSFRALFSRAGRALAQARAVMGQPGAAAGQPGTAVGQPWAAFVAAAVGAIGGFVLHGLVEYNWFSPKTAFTFWLVIGLGAGAAATLRRLGTAHADAVPADGAAPEGSA